MTDRTKGTEMTVPLADNRSRRGIAVVLTVVVAAAVAGVVDGTVYFGPAPGACFTVAGVDACLPI